MQRKFQYPFAAVQESEPGQRPYVQAVPVRVLDRHSRPAVPVIPWAHRKTGRASRVAIAVHGRRVRRRRLGNNGDRVSGDRARDLRYDLLRAANGYSPHENVQKCRRCPRGPIEVHRGADGRAFFRGLCNCSSVWECPVCAHAICLARGSEISRMLDRNRHLGGGAIMVTLTLPHDQGDALRPMAAHVARAVQYVQSGREWIALKSLIGFRASVRALEVTSGECGWHPHAHLLVLVERPLNDVERDFVREYFYRRWTRAITRPNKETGRTYRAPSREHGVTVTESHRDDYLAKLGLADELAMGATKRARGARRTAFQILADIYVADRARDRDASMDASRDRDVALFQEYARGMRGRRQLTWSRGARTMFGLGEELEDEQLMSAAEAGEAPEFVATIDRDVWTLVMRAEKRAAILRAAESGGAEAVLILCDELRGLPRVPF